MTLDAAIKYMSDFAEIFKQSAACFTNNNQDNNTMREYYEEQANAHIQIARWLEDYKRLSSEKEQDIYERAYKDGYDKGYDQGRFNGYRKAVNDFNKHIALNSHGAEIGDDQDTYDLIDDLCKEWEKFSDIK